MAESFVWQQAGDEEFLRANQLLRVSLFVELNLDSDEIARARELFGRLVHKHRNTFGSERLINRFPALTLTTLIGHAALDYEQNRYWESFWSELDMPRDAEFEKLLRTKLRQLLRKFELREFPELRHQYVQVMAVHAGVPRHCLDDLVDVIEQHIAHGREPSGAAVFEWLTEPGMGYRLNQLDVPVRNFLQFGGAVAVDIVDRIIEFASYTLDHTDAANDLDLDTSTTGLPSILLEALIDRLEERPFGSGAVDPAAAARAHRPTIAYSRLDDQIMVEVPYPTRSPEVPWLVSFDGDSREVYAEREWGLADGDVHPATPVPVPRRVRQIVLSHQPSGAQHQISLVDKENPILLFDDRGRLLSRHLALPRGEVIAVHPHDAVLVDAQRKSPVPSSAVCTPAGWRDWRAHLCDLSEVDSVQLRRDRWFGPVRQVRAIGAARLETAEPLEGVTTRNGLPVYAERPVIILPPGGAEPIVWRVRVRRTGTVDWLTDEEWESGRQPTDLDPFEGVAAGLLGMFDLVVSGPLGSDIRHSFFMAEGLVIEHGTEFRVPIGEGLSPTVCELVGLPPLELDREIVEFDSGTRETDIRVRSGDLVERLVLRPPHIELRVDGIDSAAQWRTAPTVLAVEDLSDHALVAVRVPGEVEVDIALADTSGTVVQVETPQVNQGNVFQVPTRAFVDTARRLRIAELVVRIDTADGTTRSVTLARVRPPQLCSGVRVDDDHLLFEGVTGTDLAAFVWADTAPWRTPIQVAIEAGRAELPTEWVGAGPLTVQVFVDDPWALITAPMRPEATAVRVEQPGWMTDAEPARMELSRFLAGYGAPPSGSAALSEMWTVLASLPMDAFDGTTDRVRAGLVKALTTDVRSALEALEQSTIPQNEFPALVIRTGLMEHDFSSVIRDGVHSNPWIGCLIDIADLPLLALRSPDSAAREELVGQLANLGGQSLVDLLSGRVGDSQKDIFDQDTARMREFPAARMQEMKDACEIVPGALLDSGTRQSGIFEAFARRFTWQDDPAQKALTSGSPKVMTSLRRASPYLCDVVTARNEVLAGVDTTELPWMLMSMQSLLLAAAARLMARGKFPVPPISESTRSAWARLAELCPAVVSADLLIADALTCFDLHGDLIGETR